MLNHFEWQNIMYFSVLLLKLWLMEHHTIYLCIYLFIYLSFIAELTQKKGDENVAKIPIIKKSAVTLKKELAQKTDDLNKALKKENELQVGIEMTSCSFLLTLPYAVLTPYN